MYQHLRYDRFPPMAVEACRIIISFFREYWEGERTFDELQKEFRFRDESKGGFWWEPFSFWIFEWDDNRTDV